LDEKHTTGADGQIQEYYATQEQSSTPPVATTQIAPAENEKDNDEEEEVDDTVYPSGFKLIMITVALCLSVFCMALDNTIIATAHPQDYG